MRGFFQDFMTNSSLSLSRQSIRRFSAFNFILLLLLSIWLWQQNKPVPLPQANLPADSKIQCVSYAPYFNEGQTPLNINTFISHEQIDRDLSKLSSQFDCVRIYSVSQGLDYVPEAASKLGMKVYVGAWIGWIKKTNDKELKLAIEVSNKHPETVKALIVGNEVLLRGEQTESAMKAYLDQAKSASHVPVTYADVWEFWRKHPALEGSVDFVTVHILPYWEDKPQPIERAIDHTQNVMNLLALTFKKPILIGETGWPSIGRQRDGSQPSAINQALYIRSFLKVANEKHWNYNLIEAVDQPWKRELEGTVGGYWGIFNTDLQPKFSFTENVAEKHDGKSTIYAGLAGILLFLAWSLFIKIRKRSELLSMSLLGALSGISTFLQSEYLISACRSQNEWMILGGIALLGSISLLSLPSCAFNNNQFAKRVIQLSFTIISLAALSANYLLITDGRYRDFAVSLYALPIIQLSIGLWILQIKSKPSYFIYRIISILIVTTAAFCLYKEPTNLLATTWFALCGLLAWANWPSKLTSTNNPSEK